MDDYMRDPNFFTPRRPSFRTTPPHHSYGNGNRSVYTNSGGHHNRRPCTFHNMTPPFVDDHRRMHSHGGSLYNHSQGQRNYYSDRYGREHVVPVMYNGYSRYQQRNGGYGPFSQGVFTPPPGRGSKGKGRRDGSKDKFERRSSEENRSTSPSSGTNESMGRSSSPAGGSVAGEERRDESNEQEQQVHGSPAVNQQQIQMSTPQQQDVQYLYNYNTPEDLSARKRHYGPVPVQAIHFNDDGAQQWPVRKDGLEAAAAMKLVYEAAAQRAFQQQPPNHVFVDQHGMAQQQQPRHFQEMHPVPPPYPVYSYVHVQCGQPHFENAPVFQNFHHPPPPPTMMQIAGQAVLCNNGPYKFIDAARAGFLDFQKDYKDDEEDASVEKEPQCTHDLDYGESGYVQNLGPTTHRPEFKSVNFFVDDRDFQDKRNVYSWMQEGDKEYKLFEDNLNPVRDIIREVYNVTDIDHHNLSEICGVKILPQALQKWPLEIMGVNWTSLKKRIVNFSGGVGNFGVYVKDGSAGNSKEAEENRPVENLDEAAGVGPLAKLLAGGGGEQCLGLATFLGMNVDKLVKDLDSPKPITPGFAGPLADRNHSVDCGFNEVIEGTSVTEYNLPFEAEGAFSSRMANDAFEWTQRHRLTRSKFGDLTFEVLLYIFYTCTGDALQLLAAKEMYARGWRFHKVFQVWITPIDCEGEPNWSHGVYKYFHYGKWTFFKGEFRIRDGLLEGEPLEVVEPLWD